MTDYNASQEARRVLFKRAAKTLIQQAASDPFPSEDMLGTLDRLQKECPKDTKQSVSIALLLQLSGYSKRSCYYQVVIAIVYWLHPNIL